MKGTTQAFPVEVKQFFQKIPGTVNRGIHPGPVLSQEKALQGTTIGAARCLQQEMHNPQFQVILGLQGCVAVMDQSPRTESFKLTGEAESGQFQINIRSGQGFRLQDIMMTADKSPNVAADGAETGLTDSPVGKATLS